MVVVIANDRPIVHPFQRLQVNDPSVGTPVLKMHKPGFARLRFDPGALVRAVDFGCALCEYDLVIVRTEDVFGTQHSLPAFADAAGRRENIVIAISLVEFRSLDGGMIDHSVENRFSIVKQLSSFGTHAIDCQNALNPGPALGPGMNEVRIAVVIPERARIDPAFGFPYKLQRLPRTGGVLRPGHEDAAIRIAEINVELAVVEAQGRGPHAIAMLRHTEAWYWVILENVANDRPVHQILRMENWQARRTVETGGDQIKIIIVADHVRVGIIGKDDGVLVGPIAVIRHPGEGDYIALRMFFIQSAPV